ncbi:hypothetical protein [Kribbella sp. VKM Ac-2569]|uniref:hypothetical protein n=1 Tax=Kribbella sp. VKM Ac-2569 TaxID=2512220 RepID=UPI001F5400D1|nr:hypothetical protein [Kribbella sp. VKM Ac-2569]
MSGKNANPHGTSIPVATVPATVSWSVPVGAAVPELAGADVDGELVGAASEHPLTNANAATTAVARPPPIAAP